MNDKWSPERRLKLIRALAGKSIDRPVGETHRELMQRIAFLCDMPAKFLELNSANYEDAIRLVDADLTVFL